MLTVVHESDHRSREILSVMLRELGFKHIHATPNLEESLYFLDKEQDRIDLIISSFSEEDGFDFPLARTIIKTPNLDNCPLLVLTEDWRDKPYSPFQRRLSRVDGVLAKPFGKRMLAKRIAQAFQSRARFRNTLVFYGSKTAGIKVEDAIFSNPEMQWKAAITFSDPKRLSAYLFTHERRVGGLVFELDAEIGTQAEALRRFKRTRQGASVPFAIYGQNPVLIEPFLTFVDMSFSNGTEWMQALQVLSKRSVNAWSVGNAVRSIRAAMKKNDFEGARRILARAKAIDSERWEVLELEGHLNADPAPLRQALCTQPGSPYAYLSLLPLVSEFERQQLMNQSVLFFPRHPELMILRK